MVKTIEYILLAVIKIFDNIITTAKNLATYKEQKFLSSILVIVSQLLFYLVIGQVINDNTMLAIIIVSVSSGLGNYIAFTINDKFKQDVKYVIVITSSEINNVKLLCDYLVKNKIKYIANDGYTRKGVHTLNVIAFSKNKDESRIIDYFINNSKVKYLKEVIM